MAIQNIICVFLHAAVVRPVPISQTSAPHTTVYKVPDSLLQPPKIKTDTFRKTSSGSPPQTRSEVGKTIPRIDPNRSQTKTTTWRRIPEISQNPALTKAETNKSITAKIVSQTKTDALRKTQGIKLNPFTANTDTFKNISADITPDQVKPNQSKISNSIAKTPTVAQASGNGRPASGKPNVSNNLYRLYFSIQIHLKFDWL